MNDIYESKRVGEYYKYNKLSAWEKCIECYAFSVKDICQQCGEGLCNQSKCCDVFPHKDNKNFVICKTCSSYIEDKFVLVINYDDLRILKHKINKKIVRKIKNISNM